MSLIRSFEGYAPPARFEEEADPFTKALIEEGAERDGSYTVLETIELTPVDTNPAEPLSRNFSTDKAELSVGWYRITWEDASGDTFASTPVLFPTLPPWAPSIADVAALIRARTQIPGGEEIGTFNSETRPLGSAVERLIRSACRRVSTAVSAEPCTEDLRIDAGSAAALYAAMLVEQSYFPEQTNPGGASFQSLNTLWKDQIKVLTEAVGDQCGGGGGDSVGSEGSGQVAYAFFDEEPLIGRIYPTW